MNEDVIFLDANATTPVDPQVLDAMLPWMRTAANSHSANAAGRAASTAVEKARSQVAGLIGAAQEEIVFVPSATMATNIALRSLATASSVAVRSAIEHPCVVETLADMAPQVSTMVVDVTDDGLIDPESVEAVLSPDVSVVAVMAVNNEVGTIQPIGEIGAMCDYLGIPFFVDLAQAAGRIPVDVRADGVTAAAVSSHKLYGPQGIGALFCRADRMRSLKAIATGGGQERALSPGTLPTALCVGFGMACELAAARMSDDAVRIGALRDRLMLRLMEGIPGIEVNGSPANRVANNLNVSLPGIDADELLARVPQLVISTGSACSSGAIGRSPVLIAMGLDEGRMDGAIRFGLGRFTTLDEVDRAAALVVNAVMPLGRKSAKR